MASSGRDCSLKPVAGSGQLTALTVLNVLTALTMLRFLPFIFPVTFFSSISWEFLLIRRERSKVRDVVCVQIVKPSQANLSFVILGWTK